LGFNLYLTKDARISSIGTIETLFKDIYSGDGVFYDPFEEAEKVKAVRTADEAVCDQVAFIKKPNGEVTLPEKTDSITHATITNHNFLGYSASLIPFIQHNDGCRALMGANMMKQAVLLRNPEPPLVKTGFEAVIAEKYNQSQSPFIKDNQLCLGRNLLVGYMPWDLLNYEDGMVISDRLVTNHFLTHIETEDIIFDQMDGETIDLNSVVAVGSEVYPGARIIKKSRIITDVDTKYLPFVVKEKSEDCSLRVPSDLTGVVKERLIYASPQMKKEIMTAPKDIKVQFTRKLPGKSALRIMLKIEKAYPVKVGDKLTGRHGNKGVVSAILSEQEMPYFYDEKNECSCRPNCLIIEPHTHLDVMLNPLSITGRMNVGQLYETALGWIAKHTTESDGITVDPFSRKWSWKRIESEMKDKKLCSKQKLFYCKNGVEIQIGSGPSGGQITVGYQYMMKLHHHAGKKITSRSQENHEYDLTMGQPIIPKSPPTDMRTIWRNRESKKRKAQRLGEMEVWALQGHSAWNIINEFLFLKSDAEKDRSHFVKYINLFSRKM